MINHVDMTRKTAGDISVMGVVVERFAIVRIGV